MRPIVLALLIPIVCDACATRHPQTSAPAARQAVTLDPAPTPADAFERAVRAMAEGDEEAWRRIVVYRPPSVVAEAQALSRFAGARLHRAVRENGVAGRRVRDAGFDRNECLVVPAPPSPRRVEEELAAAARNIRWTVDGDVATPATTRPLFGPEKQARVERLGHGWVVILSDGGALPNSDPEIVRYAQSDRIYAGLFDEATAAVNAGKLKTVREVNDFIDRRRDAVSERAIAKLKAGPPTGPTLLVTDAETRKPIEGARVWAEFVVAPMRLESLNVTTDAAGRGRFTGEPAEWIHGITVSADGFAQRPADVSVHREPGRPDEIRIALGKPAVVEVMLVFSDERRAALNIYEGSLCEPASAGLAATLEPRRLIIPVKWEDEPPQLPGQNPMLRLTFDSSPHRGKAGMIHRVTRARTAAGRELPVFRDAPPADPGSFGVYEIGRNGFRDTVFVIGSLADARATEAAAMKFQWTRNEKVLGPAPRGDGR